MVQHGIPNGTAWYTKWDNMVYRIVYQMVLHGILNGIQNGTCTTMVRHAYGLVISINTC
jgi:hypothetical protein